MFTTENYDFVLRKFPLLNLSFLFNETYAIIKLIVVWIQKHEIQGDGQD